MMCKTAVKKLSFVIRYAPDQYNICKTFDKVIPENGGTLWFDWYKDQKLCKKPVENYAYALEFVPDCYKIKKMCNKAVDSYSSAIQFAPDQYGAQ